VEDGEELEFFIVIVFLKERERERERENFYGLYVCVQQQPLRWLENFFPFDIGRGGAAFQKLQIATQ
jgi:hypothetical protein